MDTPYDVILSHDTLDRTGLGYHIYQGKQASPLSNKVIDLDASHEDDVDDSAEIRHIVSQLDFENPGVFRALMTIMDLDPDDEFDPINDYPEPFQDKVSANVNYDPLFFHPIGPLKRPLKILSESSCNHVFRIPPEPARIHPFEIHFADKAPPLRYVPPRRLSTKLLAALQENCVELLALRIIGPSKVRMLLLW